MEGKKIKRGSLLTKSVDISKFFMNKAVHRGSVCVDATCGNGNDTLRLLELCGPEGRVYAFDIQEEAIKRTRERVMEKMNSVNNANEASADALVLINDGHEMLDEYVNESIDACVFNLGYLPRADHSKITKPDTTVTAIEKAIEMLNPKGVVIITSYVGHEGGMEEKSRVEELLSTLSQEDFNVLKCDFINQINNPPIVYIIEKKVLISITKTV